MTTPIVHRCCECRRSITNAGVRLTEPRTEAAWAIIASVYDVSDGLCSECYSVSRDRLDQEVQREIHQQMM